MVREQYPDVRLIESASNLGYAAGNNRAAAKARGEYLLLLNPDTVVERDALGGLLAFMEERPQAGACSPRLNLPDGSPQPFTFGEDPRPGYLLRRGWNRLVHQRPLHDWNLAIPTEMEWVSGACMLVRRAAWEEVGGFDEGFFMYFEDNDLCLRMRRAGWQVWYNPTVAITHVGGQSAQHYAASGRAYVQSLLYFYRKHYGRVPAAGLRLGVLGYRGLSWLLSRRRG